jgi:oligopeptide/dipeptide ABC transporter ATP-binding protein
VLVCDEPVSALDASLVIRVLELLESLQQRLGVALLVVTHDLAVARRVADEVAVMYRGRIVEQGPAAEIFENPAHPYTEGLLAAIPTTEVGKLAPTLAGEPPAATGGIVGCSFASRCSYVRDRCRVDDPPLYEISSSRGKACHYSDEVLAQAVRLHSGNGHESADNPGAP